MAMISPLPQYCLAILAYFPVHDVFSLVFCFGGIFSRTVFANVGAVIVVMVREVMNSTIMNE